MDEETITRSFSWNFQLRRILTIGSGMKRTVEAAWAEPSTLKEGRCHVQSMIHYHQRSLNSS